MRVFRGNREPTALGLTSNLGLHLTKSNLCEATLMAGVPTTSSRTLLGAG
jgi:hypothetical protein